MTTTLKIVAAAAWGILAVGPGSGSAAAQAAFPARQITLIVPFAAGGPTDVVGRIVSENMSRTLGQQIIIENVIGAGGTTAGLRTMRSVPDGYTIMLGHMGTHGASVALYPKLAYDPAADFAPIGMVAGMPVLVLAKKDTPARDFKEFIANLREHAAELTMAHAGLGSVSYITCRYLNALLGVEPKLVGFQGSGPAMAALVAGKVDYMCDQVVTVVPQAKAGSIRVLAAVTSVRNPILADVPTAKESGLPQFEVSAWNGLFAPKGTPQPVVEKLNAALIKALDDPTVRKRLLELGSDIPEREARSPAALAALVKGDVARWASIFQSIEHPR